MIQAEVPDGLLTMYLSGKVTSANAETLKAEAVSAIEQSGCKSVEIDAENLEYISSAGLRVLLTLQKQYGMKTIRNAQSAVYDVLETTGFSELFHVTKALRRVSVEGCPIVGKGGQGTVYRLGDESIVKVYKPETSLADINHEREYAKAAFLNGINTAISYDTVKVGVCFIFGAYRNVFGNRTANQSGTNSTV